MVVSFLKDTVSVLCTGVALVLVIGMASCSKKAPDAQAPQPEIPKNSNQALINALGSQTEKIILGSDTGPQLIITPGLSARVLGASIKGSMDENLMWVDKSIMDSTYWGKDPLFWNAGGLRSWIAPEDLFFVNEKKEASSWFVPKELDPVPFTKVDEDPMSVSFRADIELPANIGKTYKFTLTRKIALITAPPTEIGALPDSVSYMGIAKVHSIVNLSDQVIGKDLPYICLWSLLQTNPSGTILVPVKEGYDPVKAYREYFNPLGDRLTVQNGIISVKIDGQYRCKIGVRPEACGEGLAFLRDDGNGQGVLFVQTFPVDPKGIYVDKPWGKESKYGDAIELYNDDGKMGGFTEIECHGAARKLAKGDSQAHSITLHIFRGPITELVKIGSTLLKADLSKAKYY